MWLRYRRNKSPAVALPWCGIPKGADASRERFRFLIPRTLRSAMRYASIFSIAQRQSLGYRSRSPQAVKSSIAMMPRRWPRPISTSPRRGGHGIGDSGCGADGRRPAQNSRLHSVEPPDTRAVLMRTIKLTLGIKAVFPVLALTGQVT